MGASELPILFIAAYVVSALLTRYRLGMVRLWILLAAHGLLWLAGRMAP